jgi:hypothetical protein
MPAFERLLANVSTALARNKNDLAGGPPNKGLLNKGFKQR